MATFNEIISKYRANNYTSDVDLSVVSVPSSSTETSPIPSETTQTETGEKGLKGFAVGLGKDVVETTRSLADLGETIGSQTVGRFINLAQGKGFTPTEPRKNILSDVDTEAVGPAEKAGKFTGELLTFLIPGSKVASATKALPVVARTATRALASGGVAAARSGKVGEEALTAAGIEAAFPIVGAPLKALGNQLKQLPNRFINSALGRSKQQIIQDLSRDKVDDFAKFVVENKPIASANKLLGDSIDGVRTLSGQIDDKLPQAVRASGDKITIGVNNFIDEIAKIPEAKGALLKRSDIKDIITKLVPPSRKLLSQGSLNVEEANQLRKLLDNTLGDKAFLGGQLSSDKVILKKFADNLRGTVKTKAPKEVRGLFDELTNEIRFRDALLNKVAQGAGKSVIGFGDILSGSFGALGGGVPGALAGVALKRGIESVPFKIGAAKATEAILKASPVLESLNQAQKSAILAIFASMASPDQPEDTVQKPENNDK